ncbi:hypothetical protein GCM10025873_05100 [Demequina sediminis]|nr:hypothetical protein GCM10025873_05100 [Demequina sediminis]
MPMRRWERADVAASWPRPGAADDKYSRGVVGVIAGSEAYPGAAALVVSAAVRAGAGMVRYVGPPRAQDLVLAHRPEAVVHHPVDAAERLPRAQAWVVGPGVADYPEQDAAIGAVIAQSVAMVVDAGALETVARARAAGARAVGSERVLLTPTRVNWCARSGRSATTSRSLTLSAIAWATRGCWPRPHARRCFSRAP